LRIAAASTEPGVTAERPRVALVQWRGAIGGAEALAVALAAAFGRLGVTAEVVFVTDGEPLSSRLVEAGVKFRSLRFERGRDIVRHARRYAAAVTDSGPDGVLLPECGFAGVALRAGGYRGKIVAVEHGALLFEGRRSARSRVLRRVSRLAASVSDDVEVGVSDFMIDRMRDARSGPLARRIAKARLTRIYNGVDPARFRKRSADQRLPGAATVVGFAGRLIPGKGADDLIGALARSGRDPGVRLRIAGDGPEQMRLRAIASRLGIADRVEFLGMIDDLPGFWGECDLAAVPSHEFVESFGMTALEAMACAMPVVATRNGALPELVRDGLTGTIVAPGDVEGLRRALVAYAENSALRDRHGLAGRARVIERFGIDDCARSYLRCLGLAHDG